MNRVFVGMVLGALLSGPVSAARMFEPMAQGGNHRPAYPATSSITSANGMLASA